MSDAVRIYFKDKNGKIVETELANPFPILDNAALQVARGIYNGMSGVNKYGQAHNGVQTTITDIWDRADATPTQQIWIAPTAARIHAIVSSDANDTSAGTGARTIRITGLTSWTATGETSETIIMAGATPVNTVNSYVIIHRMQVLTSGGTTINAGNITATAETNNTVTAQISIGYGQTQMAIYGVPSTKTLYLTKWFAASDRNSGTAADVEMFLKVNVEPTVQTTQFITKDIRHISTDGTSAFEFNFDPYRAFPGPCIIKVSAIASGADIECAAGFDGYLVNN